MAKKCDICSSKIETTFLGKVIGTKIGKKYACSKCQGKFKEDLKKELAL